MLVISCLSVDFATAVVSVKNGSFDWGFSLWLLQRCRGMWTQFWLSWWCQGYDFFVVSDGFSGSRGIVATNWLLLWFAAHVAVLASAVLMVPAVSVGHGSSAIVEWGAVAILFAVVVSVKAVPNCRIAHRVGGVSV